MKKHLLTIICCVIVAIFLGFCMWRSTEDVFLSASVAVLGTVLGLALLWQSEKDWQNGMGDIMETGYHKEDPRHPRNPACADELLTGQDHQCGIQITPQGNVMLHRNPGCYTSPFSLN